MLKIRELRKAKGLTQQQLAEKVGVLNVSISNYERGAQMPDLLTTTKIAEALDVSVDTLLGTESTENDFTPHTKESMLLVKGVDKMPEEDRKQVLNVVKAAFYKFSDYFEEKENNVP